MSAQVKNKRFLYDQSTLDKMKQRGLYFFMKTIEGFSKGTVNIEGRNFINFTSNDYLGLANHLKVKEAAIRAVNKYGVGSGQTRVFGTLDIHEELERKLAEFIGTEDVVIFNSGYMANLGTVPNIVGKDDFIIRDEFIHASIVDACRMSNAINLIFRHNDMKSLEDKLAYCDSDKKKLILVDSIYSMHGDIADLPQICKLKKKYNAILMIDDAHATGILGSIGSGAADHFGVTKQVDIIMGSIGKSLGGMGGFIGSSKEMITGLKHRARSFIFTTSLPAPLTMSMIAAIDLIKEKPQIRQKLIDNAKKMRNELSSMGYDIGQTETQIIPIIIGDEFKMYEFVAKLFKLGIAVNPVTFPAVKSGRAQVRVCISSLHTKLNLNKAIECFKKAGKELELI